MKKYSLIFLGLFSFVLSMHAQDDDCMTFFPNKEGAMLVNTTYDANNNMIMNTTYRIDKIYDYVSGTNMEVDFTITNSSGVAIDHGTLQATCDDGNFYVKMVNQSMAPEVMKMLTTDTALLGNFMDYPYLLNDDIGFPYNSAFQTDEEVYTIQAKNDKDHFIRVRIYNREYDKNEMINTPAQSTSFDASKVTYTFEVTPKGEKSQTYTGIDWYAPDAGIVRSETYDQNKNLVSYTVLTTLRNNK
ncbi:MAG: hypothetical protein LUG18_10415 [Candidatus Azobacteroides sp.]|nr:hypothetical protein [Candidatus Azobacteroides sp.]